MTILQVIPFAIINLPKSNCIKIHFVYRPYGTYYYDAPVFYRYCLPIPMTKLQMQIRHRQRYKDIMRYYEVLYSLLTQFSIKQLIFI